MRGGSRGFPLMKLGEFVVTKICLTHYPLIYG
jgi:hypothetical protein